MMKYKAPDIIIEIGKRDVGLYQKRNMPGFFLTVDYSLLNIATREL